MPIPETISYANMLRTYTDARSWFEALGAPFGPSSRLAHYHREMGMIASHFDLGTIEAFSEERGFQNLVRLLMEVGQINKVYQGLKTLDSPGLRGRLKRMRTGDPSVLNERREGNNLPRNAAFELEIASLLSLAGFDPNLEGECDIWIEKRLGCPLAIECKRPFSGESVQKNIEKGLSQLRRRFSERPESRGILFLSLTRAHDDGSGDESWPLRVINYPEMEAVGTQVMKSFVRDYRRLWENQRTPSKVIAVVFHLVMPTLLSEPNELRYFVTSTHCNVFRPTTEENSLSSQIAEAIRKMAFTY